MDLATRLKTFITSKGIGNSEFADRAGIPRPTLSQLLSGRNKSVNDIFIGRLHSAYPELNVNWLLFGEGDMVIGANIEISEPQNAPETAQNAQDTTDVQSVTPITFPTLFDRISEQSTEKAPAKAKNEPIPGKESQSATNQASHAKQIKNIMVFYNDNSYEIFHPAAEK